MGKLSKAKVSFYWLNYKITSIVSVDDALHFTKSKITFPIGKIRYCKKKEN